MTILVKEALSNSSQEQVVSPLAQVAVDELLSMANRQGIAQGIAIEQWVISPDALHMLVVLKERQQDGRSTTSKPRCLTSFVASFKAATATRINLLRNQPGSSVWQRSYQEQLIKDSATLNRFKKRMNEETCVVMSDQIPKAAY